jgi:rubrerythrin
VSAYRNPRLAAVEIDGHTRSAFLLRAVFGAGALYGTAAVTPLVRRAAAQSGGDVDIVNFALTLEYLEADFYRRAREIDLGSELVVLAEEFGNQEQEHVDGLVAMVEELGGEPAQRPKFAFPLNDRADFEKLAVTLEDTGVSAYNGAAPAISEKRILAALGGIVQVEARHAGALRFVVGKEPAPDTFDPALEREEVLRAVEPFVVSPS